MTPQQLTLPVGVVGQQEFATFYPGAANAELLAAVRALLDERGAQCYLWAGQGEGKTHLATALCTEAAERGLRAAYLSMRQLSHASAFDGIEQCAVVALDDLEALAVELEEPLFHALNRCREQPCSVLLCASGPVDELDIGLADLRTRLSWGAVYQIRALADAELADALRALFKARGLGVRDEVIAWLLKRSERDMTTLSELVRRIDRRALQERHRVTLPLVKAVMGEE